MEKQITKRKHISSFIDEMGCWHFSPSMCDELILLAEKQGITELVMTSNEFDTFKKYVLGTGNGTWNWDKKTFWGINLIIED